MTRCLGGPHTSQPISSNNIPLGVVKFLNPSMYFKLLQNYSYICILQQVTDYHHGRFMPSANEKADDDADDAFEPVVFTHIILNCN